jgi:hypothetical protein
VLKHRALWRTLGRIGLAGCSMLALSACGAHYAQVPARLNLEPYGRVALVTFSTEQPDKQQWSTMATQRFAEALLASQSHIELIELPVSDSTARALAQADDPSELLAAIGRERRVPAVFLGRLSVSGVKPRGGLINAARGLKVQAEVSAQLSVRLLSTGTGGTMWRSSSIANGTVGRVALADATPSVAVRNPDDAYGELVGELVHNVTRDLRPTFVKQ